MGQCIRFHPKVVINAFRPGTERTICLVLPGYMVGKESEGCSKLLARDDSKG